MVPDLWDKVPKPENDKEDAPTKQMTTLEWEQNPNKDSDSVLMLLMNRKLLGIKAEEMKEEGVWAETISM